MSSNELIIPLSKTKVVFLIFGSMGFIALGAWFLTLDTEEILVSRKFISPELVYGIGMVSIVFFGLCGMIGVKKFLDTKPGLILNSKGVTDNSSGVSAGFIPWSEIVGINESHIHKQKFVSIMLKNPEKYLNSGNALQKMTKKANIKMCGTPINISSNSLKINYEELLKTFTEYHQKIKKHA